MDMLAVIPARGGSKGIPRKNLIDLGGKPLLAWTIQAALESKSISRVIVSTEDNEIADCAESFGAEVPFMRPMEIAGDDVHAVQVVRSTLAGLKEKENYHPQFIAMLLPTSPLKTSDDIDACAAVLKAHPDCSAISVSELHYFAEQFRHLRNGVLEPLIKAETYTIQRQDAEPVYTANGAVFMSSVACLEERKEFHHPGARAYVMPFERSIDINSETDLELARYLLGKSRHPEENPKKRS